MGKVAQLEHFFEELQKIPDYREEWKVKHSIGDIIAIALIGQLARCDDLKETHYWATINEEVLRKYLKLKNGIPGYDTMRRVLAVVDSHYFNKMLQKWNELTKTKVVNKLKKILAIDGKTERGNGNYAQKPNHIVSAIDEDGVCFGQELVNEKSNEITAVPKLLEILDIKNNIVTTDAMGTQVDIVDKIIEKEGDYVLALKGNQGNFYDNVKLYFDDSSLLKNCDYHFTLEKARSCIEKREYWTTEDIDWLPNKSKWKGIKSISFTKNTIEKRGIKTVETRYFISSLPASAKEIGRCIRKHWMVESFHWHLDVTFREDNCRVLDKKVAYNLNILRKFAITILRQSEIFDKKISLKNRRLGVCAAPLKFLENIFSI
jgi:predicted transposase YbfD/YdcC